jgi:hypothetical protein
MICLASQRHAPGGQDDGGSLDIFFERRINLYAINLSKSRKSHPDQDTKAAMLNSSSEEAW